MWVCSMAFMDGANMMERVRSINESQEPKMSAVFTFSALIIHICQSLNTT